MTATAHAAYADGLAGLLADTDSPARQRLLALMGELLEEAGRREVVRDRPTDEELLGGHRLDQERRGLMAATVSNRHRRVGALMAWMAPRSVLDATAEDLQSYLDARDIGNGSRRDYLSHWRQFYGWAVKQGLLVKAPTDDILAPKRRPGMPKPLTDAELELALNPAHFGRTYAHRRLRALVLLGAFEGLRAQEMAGLCVEDVVTAKGALRVRRGKGGKQRTLPLHPDVLEALEALPLPASGSVFRIDSYGGQSAGTAGRYPPADRPINPWNVSKMVREYLHGLGIDASCHSLRHTFATKIYQATQDLRLTQELMGHSSVATTQIYAACDTAKAAPAVMALRIGGGVG